MEVIKLKDDYIKLGQALKACGLAQSGVDAKFAIQDGLVKVNGKVELQRGKVYEFNAEWLKENYQKNKFYGIASYVFVTE